MIPRIIAAACATVLLADAGFAAPALSIEATSDHRRRGISWSDGRAALRASADLPVGDINLRADIATLRGAARHGGADIGTDLGAAYRRDFGGWSLSAWATHHMFDGRGRLDYAEIGTGAAILIGPAQIDLFASYAPSQRAIGGDNLYLGSSVSVGIVGTPYTVSAQIGRSSGTRDHPARAGRLRPDGSYVDYGLAVDRNLGVLSVGVAFSGTTIDQVQSCSSNSGKRVFLRSSARF